MANEGETIQIFFLIFSGLLMTILFLSKYLHDSPRVNAIVSEPAMTLLVGMSFSFVVSLIFVFEEEERQYNENEFHGNVEYEVEQDLANSILSFQTRIFFLALLPPILFNSGYQLQRELFYRHLAPISLFACLGTCISGFSTGGLLLLIRRLGLFGGFYPTVMELLTFGALIAATDTVSVVGILQAKQVDPHLFSLVFGESALNDAVSIVLYKTLSTFLIQDAFGDSSNLVTAILKFLAHLTVQATCSPLLGMFYAFCLAWAFKKVDLREHKMLELSLYIMPMYIPYMLGEALNLSGMITIFFTGIFAKRYMAPNVSEETRQNAEMLFKLFAFLAETCIFLELGLSVFGLSGAFQWQFIGWAVLAALIGRAASIYPLAACYNLSLTKVVTVCTCSDDTSLSTMDSSSAGHISVASGSITTGASSGNSSWSRRRETPKKQLDKRIPLNFMHMLTFAGLRGAVAYACARDFPNMYGHRDSFVTTTMVIVLFTIVIMGGATEPLMERLKIRTSVDEKEYMRHWHSQRKLKGRFHRFEYHYIYRLVVRRQKSSSSSSLSAAALQPPSPPDLAERTIRQCMTPVTDNTNHAFDYSLEDDDDDNDSKQSYQPSINTLTDDDTTLGYKAPTFGVVNPEFVRGQVNFDDTDDDGSIVVMNDDSNVFNLYEDGGEPSLRRARDLPVDYVQQPKMVLADDECSLRHVHHGDDDQSSLGSTSFREHPSQDRTDGSINSIV